ncbi:MAG TPA: fumarylacetoacetate hydrolase family protein [Vicinamibacterales bacterium]|jgi:2-keto-4-pentenoate hydratase/2-oxohepta-3-ene-1,7-dioic acid hydratase in catechol pathway|nr:fumarylacetoacetate hydrolase family protein [Vicinamibacterales bacterium]
MTRFYRIEHHGEPRHVIEEGGVWRLLEGDLFDGHRSGDEIRPEGGRLLPPIIPSKMVCIGLNYKDHAAEQNKPLPKEPLMFIKPSTAVIGPGEAIVVPADVGRVDHEAELGVVIGRRARHVREADAPGYVLGLICVNDVSARELQYKGFQYTHAKGFDTFAPIGPCIAAGLDYHAAEGIGVEGWVNGERRQHSTTAQLVFSIDYLIAYITRVMTLLPGDIIATGTPSGVGPIAPGDTVTIKVAGVGELTNTVRGERP